MSAQIRVFTTKLQVATAGAEMLAEAAREGGHIALAGGSSPEEAYKQAARMQRDWSEADVWLSDERCVEPYDERSNFGMVERSLLAPLPADLRPRVHRIEGERGPDEAADAYEALIHEELGESPVFDLILLGLGADAHTASLFPGKPEVEERDRHVVGVEQPGMEPMVERVTFTLPLINAAAHVVFLVAGSDKGEAMARAFGSPADRTSPAAPVRPRRLTVLCDEAAAGEL